MKLGGNLPESLIKHTMLGAAANDEKPLDDSEQEQDEKKVGQK